MSRLREGYFPQFLWLLLAFAAALLVVTAPIVSATDDHGDEDLNFNEFDAYAEGDEGQFLNDDSYSGALDEAALYDDDLQSDDSEDGGFGQGHVNVPKPA